MAEHRNPDDLAALFPQAASEPIDPVAMARRDLKKALPKRFYREARAEPVEGGFALTLDGKPAKTPARQDLVLPTLAAAEALAAEWNAQEDIIDPSAMPLTRLANSAIDGVRAALMETVEEIARYGGSDLVCYRAEGPDSLVAAQAAAWDPVLAFAREKLGARFLCAEGVVFVTQPEEAEAALLKAVQFWANDKANAPFAVAALHVMTSLMGSALMALGVAHGLLRPEEAWASAHVDEDFQMRVWGRDEEALERRTRRWRDMEAAARLFQSVQS
ncbi:ATP12 family chaperone protein [Beijerinckia indica]|uniref:ATP12 ATPase n=1 Tax=Beijerinckia indica subsp. indica (strain ATCC 9039 / DSM 1715 / NCIMB 8712) TaxID=395963 RepID=B2IK22_BEII9|nr:ATP12 family protein [Beijerinckia indica]ACB94954.1 ATP12 ATPase [Beijerinckia indica subsp. indica ATCC 9039]